MRSCLHRRNAVACNYGVLARLFSNGPETLSSEYYKLLATNIPTMYTCTPLDPHIDFTKASKRASDLFNLPGRYIHPREFNYQLPVDGIPEFAFVGRSNVGKSTLVGTLLGDLSLVKISKKPGCTQNVNYFAFESKNHGKVSYLVDLPGYGYAAASKKDKDTWKVTMENFLKGRDFLTMRRVFLLIDSRRGVKAIDEDMMKLLNNAGLPFQIVMTKTDCVSKIELLQHLQLAFDSTAKRNRQACVPVIHAISSRNGTGIADLKREIASIVYRDLSIPEDAIIPSQLPSNSNIK